MITRTLSNLYYHPEGESYFISMKFIDGGVHNVGWTYSKKEAFQEATRISQGQKTVGMVIYYENPMEYSNAWWCVDNEGKVTDSSEKTKPSMFRSLLRHLGFDDDTTRN
jgi:hypothetical protein